MGIQTEGSGDAPKWTDRGRGLEHHAAHSGAVPASDTARLSKLRLAGKHALALLLLMEVWTEAFHRERGDEGNSSAGSNNDIDTPLDFHTDAEQVSKDAVWRVNNQAMPCNSRVLCARLSAVA